jgi:phosphatidylglycerol:prolipoprotein diacylglycerol transferase
MLQTLFYIPHWFLDGPLVIGWLVFGLAFVAWQLFREGNSTEVWSFVPVFLLVAAAIHFFIPNVEVMGIDPANPEGPAIVKGLAVRGYGVMLLTAIVAGTVLAMLRSDKIGVTKDQLLQLGFWMMICGIAGARLFYVIQKSDQFFADGVTVAALLKIVNMTQGGLVVYGSLIGGTIAGLLFMRINKMPIWKTADIIAPGMVLGLAIGRIGCLMNGCCYGGVCSDEYPAVTFPPGSPPYMRQLAEGDLLGISGTFDKDSENLFPVTVESVTEGSFAEQNGVKPGDQLQIGLSDGDYLRFKKANPGNDGGMTFAVVNSSDGKRVSVPLDALPKRSARTHPTQIYSAINAILLCAVLWFFWSVKKHDGQVFALMLILYAIARFLMEIVRQDERGLFGTNFTISQWVSMGMVVIGFALFAAVMNSPKPAQQSVAA